MYLSPYFYCSAVENIPGYIIYFYYNGRVLKIASVLYYHTTGCIGGSILDWLLYVLHSKF